ncbi:MAG: hypothetical protein GY719_28925 [bacterium]|nr:hypothetical protein [bacterium]
MNRFVKPSKTVTDGQKSAASLEAASFEIAADVADAVENTFRPWLEEGEKLPDQEELRQHLLGRWLRNVRDQLVAADEAHQQAVWAERRLRRRRDDQSGTLEGKIRDIRSTFEKVYGDGLAAEVVGLASDIPDDPVVVHRYARRIIRIMEDPDLLLPEPQVQGSAIGPQDVVEEITPHVMKLEEVLHLHELQKRKSQLALQNKREALDDFNFARGRVARYLEALCYLAGKDFHAKRVRRSSHGRAEPDETFDSDEEEAEAADSDEDGVEQPEESPTSDD